MNALPVFLPVHHALHRPLRDYSDGLPPVPHPEAPQRIESILSALREADGIALHEVEALADDETLARLHDRDYLAFLEEIGNLIGDTEEYLPGVFRDDLSRAPLAMRGGMYCREIGTPLRRGSMRAARNSAAAALAAAKAVRQGADTAIALCRPPGHHAGRRRYGGYCLLNNACLAASHLGERRGPVAVLDLDYHLGDGSLEFADETLRYWSLHADPWLSYPWLDAGVDPGGPFVRLRSLPEDCDGACYLALLDEVLAEITACGCRSLVLSLGFDTLAGDDIQDQAVQLEMDDYRAIAIRVRALGLPAVIVLEGGYDAPRLGDCMTAFLAGWKR